MVDKIFAGGEATNFSCNVAGRLAGKGMFAEEFESCGDAFNDAVGDA